LIDSGIFYPTYRARLWKQYSVSACNRPWGGWFTPRFAASSCDWQHLL